MEDLLRIKELDEYFKTYVNMLFAARRYDIIQSVVKNKRKKDPENVYLLMILARAQAKDNKLLDAIESYKMVLIINPEQLEALHERANLHLQRNELDNARTYFEKALNVNDKYAMAELGLAKVFEALGERDKYLEHLRKAQELDPKNNVILKEVAKVQSK